MSGNKGFGAKTKSRGKNDDKNILGDFGNAIGKIHEDDEYSDDPNILNDF
jgi:hypothetical protein